MERAFVPEYLRPVEIRDNVRIGGRHDGGYIVPLCIAKQTQRLLSFGISLDWAFEKEFLKTSSMCHAECFDRTTTLSRALSWGITRTLYAPVSLRPIHAKAFLKPLDYLMFFGMSPRVTLTQKHVGTEAMDGTVALADLFPNSSREPATFLKMDIEGGEYDLLPAIFARSTSLSGLVVEFHRCLSEPRFENTVRAAQKHFVVTHLHANSVCGLDRCGRPTVLEITFANRSFWPQCPPIQGDTYRHCADAANDSRHADYLISFLG